MSLESFQNIMAPQIQGLRIIQCRQDDVVFQIAVNQYAATYVDVNYTYSRPARQNDPLHKPDRPIPGATDIPEEFYAELQQLKNLGQAYKEIFDVTKVRQDRVLHWLMRSTLGTEQEIKDLTDRGILLVGDAVHAMPILSREGGNNAMKDSVDLAEHLVHTDHRVSRPFLMPGMAGGGKGSKKANRGWSRCILPQKSQHHCENKGIIYMTRTCW